jgi:arsenate reductase
MGATLYGIRNCDTVRKARAWLAAEGIDYRFHDFHADGLTIGTLNRWNKAAGWETLLNRRGTSWRQLPDKVRDHINGKLAIELMLDNPTLIKRPVLEYQDAVYVGFSAAAYQAIFKQ